MHVIDGMAGQPLPRGAPQEGVLLLPLVLLAGSAGEGAGCTSIFRNLEDHPGPEPKSNDPQSTVCQQTLPCTFVLVL